MNNLSRTYRFIALCLVALVFVSSAGITVDFHFCNGELKSYSLIGKAKPCHEPTLKQCPFHKKMMVNSNDKKGCCENKAVHFQSDQDQKIEVFNFNLQQPIQQFFAAYTIVYFIDSNIEKELLSFARYKPPLISRDISVLFQSFLL